MSVLIVNTNNISHYTIKEYKGLVSANQVVGANFFADLFASITDFVGGNSGAYRESLDTLYRDVTKQLNEKAKRMGANAIVGFRIDFDEISGKGKSMFMVTGVGTAVLIEPDRYEMYEKLHKLHVYLTDGLLTQEQYEWEKEQIKKNNEHYLADDFQKHVEEQTKEQVKRETEEKLRQALDQEKKLRNAKLSALAANLWMMSVDDIEQAEVPFTLKGDSIDDVIYYLLCDNKFNEAGKFYMEETGLDAQSAYDYVYDLCTRAMEG